MNITQIESNVQGVVKSFNKDSFIYDLLLAYGQPKASIKRLQQGGLNLSKSEDEILWKKKLYFKSVVDQDLHSTIDSIKSDEKITRHDPRFIVVTDFSNLLAIDRKTSGTLDIAIAKMAKHFDFFLPLAGMEKAQHQNENPADVKAAERMAKLYDEIRRDNPTKTPEEVHNLNVFLSRLLFCFFAEDTGIFEKVQFTNAISSHTQADGSDLQNYLDKLFEVLNTEPAKRKNLPAYLEAFPYVNGGLFRNKHYAPAFSRRSRQILIECGQLEWKDINPDIFGSMIQAVITPEHRGGLGMHYTSVPNIMKVIEPLFLNDLYTAFESAKGNGKALSQLIQRIWKIKIFDPACGSGNFLIIAYKELRKLEMKIFKELDALVGKLGSGKIDFGKESFSQISLGSFYGIELDDFAHEIATLSLWLAEHQMNQEFFKQFGRTKPALPLKEAGNIICGNATRLDWADVCPQKGGEIFLLGNPPYRGKKEQTIEQKADIERSCGHLKNYKNLDFISCWFVLASQYISSHDIRCAFVSTNSICQGEQVGLLWPSIYEKGIEICFAYTSFMWKNNAKNNAGVAVIIVGIQLARKSPKFLFTESNGRHINKLVTNKINPYLAIGSDVIVKQRTKALSDIPKISNGSMPNDNGYFFLEHNQYNSLRGDLKPFYKRVIGAREFFHNICRYTLWLDDSNLSQGLKIEEISSIVNNVRKYRLASDRDATKRLAGVPYRYGEVRYQKGDALIVPGLSAEKREYIPLGFITDDFIVTNLAQVIYGAEPWLFSVLSSKMNNIWVRATSGYFKKDVRYSPVLSYNTLPLPQLTNSQKEDLTKYALRILEERENHPEKTLAQLYDPGKMPFSLKEAHRQNDLSVENCYRSRLFESDEERSEYLFKLYEQMIAQEQSKGTLFQVEMKPKKKRK